MYLLLSNLCIFTISWWLSENDNLQWEKEIWYSVQQKFFNTPYSCSLPTLPYSKCTKHLLHHWKKKKSLYYITGSEIREGSESIFLFQRVLFNNALPEATAVQDGTRANCQKCSWKPPWSFTINSLQPSSGERLSVGHCIHLPACKTGKAAPGKEEEEKVS